MYMYTYFCWYALYYQILIGDSFFQLFSLLQSLYCILPHLLYYIMPGPIAPTTSACLYIPAHVWTKAEMDRCLQSHPLWLEDNCTQSFAALSLTESCKFSKLWLATCVCVRVCACVGGGERVLIYLFNWRVPPRSQLRVLENRLIIRWTLMKHR